MLPPPCLFFTGTLITGIDSQARVFFIIAIIFQILFLLLIDCFWATSSSELGCPAIFQVEASRLTLLDEGDEKAKP